MEAHPYLQFKNRYRSKHPNSSDDEIREAYHNVEGRTKFKDIPKDAQRKIATISPLLYRTFIYSDKNATQLDLEELRRQKCRETPTVGEFKRYLNAFMSVYSPTDSDITITYVSSYYVNKSPILTKLVFYNDIDENTGKNETYINIIILIVDYILNVNMINSGFALSKDRNQDYHKLLELITFHGGDSSKIIIDSDSLQELLDIRKSCKFTEKEVDDLVIEIYERERVIESFLDYLPVDTRGDNPYSRISLLIELRGQKVVNYFIAKSTTILTPKEKENKRNLILLYSYTPKPTDVV